MDKETISTNSAPAAIGPYSQAVRSGNQLYLSGQLPIDPTSGSLNPGDAREQTRSVLDNLCAVLAAAGASVEHVVKTTVYVTNLADFKAINEVYAERFGTQPPARATVQVAALPLGAKLEIDAIAHLS